MSLILAAANLSSRSRLVLVKSALRLVHDGSVPSTSRLSCLLQRQGHLRLSLQLLRQYKSLQNGALSSLVWSVDKGKFEWEPKKGGAPKAGAPFPGFGGGEGGAGGSGGGDGNNNNELWKKLVNTSITIFLIMFTLELMTFYFRRITGQSEDDMEKMGVKEIDWATFKFQVLAKGECEHIEVIPDKDMAVMHLAEGAIINGMRTDVRRFILRPGDIGRFEQSVREAEESLGISQSNGVTIVYRRANTEGTFLLLLGMLALSFFLVRVLTRGKGQGKSPFSMPNMFDSFRRANFREVNSTTPEAQTPKIKFKDVAGLHEAKVEVREFVDYLKSPERFTKLGAKLPKGALLLGPPGCGKTLLAKAVATETSVPFLAMNGTDFIEMIGGLGAARVRDLFKEAKKRAPCIIYIDEIDAVGKARAQSGRSGGVSGGGEEDQTLNQLLVEMDGMDSNAGVILFASTNRADMLDKALLRPGRFDRHITIDHPTLAERQEHFDMYLGKLVLESPGMIAQLSGRMAALTPGMTGADIANVCNEAAIHAASNNLKAVGGKSLDHALERVIAGSEKRSRTLSKEERTRVAFHESGHALVGWLLQHTDALLKVTIIPRTSAALGFAQYNPADQKLFSKEELFDRMCMALGGRAAENLIFGKVSTGAQNDLEKVTRIAYDQIKVYGMSSIFPPISFPPEPGMDQRQSGLALKPYSKKFAATMDQEAREIVGRANTLTEQVLRDNKDKLEKIAKELLSKETLTYEDMVRLIGPPKFAKKSVVQSVSQLFPTPDAFPEP